MSPTSTTRSTSETQSRPSGRRSARSASGTSLSRPTDSLRRRAVPRARPPDPGVLAAQVPRAPPTPVGSLVSSAQRKEPHVNLIASIDALRSRHDVLRHPFYRRWSAGELTRAELAHYAGQYRHAVVALARASAQAAF